MAIQIILNIFEQIDLHINILIYMFFLNFGLVGLKILQQLPRNILVDKPMQFLKKIASIILFFLSYILFYLYFRFILKRWNSKKENSEYTNFTKDYTMRQDARFSYFYIRCQVIKSNLYLFFWSKTSKLKAVFYFLFTNLILNYYSMWVVYWVIKFIRWFILNMSKRLIILGWRIMLWIRIQLFIYINIDTFFSLIQSLGFVKLEEDEDFILDSPPFIFYYKLRNFFF